MNNFFTAIKNFIYPKRCIFCGSSSDFAANLMLCGKCEKKFNTVHTAHTDDGTLCLCPTIYADDVKRAIKHYKFNNHPQYAHTFGYIISKLLINYKDFDCVSWVPVSQIRKLKRGFDQSELIAREISKIIDIPCVSTLKKIKNTRKQSGLGAAARKTNAHGAYVANNAARGKDIILVDDIFTTGSTMSECVRELRRAGASDILTVVIAKTNYRQTP